VQARQHHAATVADMAERNNACVDDSAADWAGNWWTLSAVWGMPAAAMIAASFAEPTLRGVIWTAMLVWMGVACVLNGRRCGRTHCRFTGPFFLVMAATVVGFTIGALPLGPHGWTILGTTTVTGNALIWWVSERLLGKVLQP
jgi:hypothetical protein